MVKKAKNIEEEEEKVEGEVEETTTDGETEAEEEGSSSAASRVTFHFSDKASKTGQRMRFFDEDTHGKDFLAVAEEFATTNADAIIKRINE